MQANKELREALTEFNSQKAPFTVRQIVNSRNLGYAAGINNALRWVENSHPHHYYLLINNDAKATPGMLQQLVASMIETDKTILAAPAIDTGSQQIFGYWYQRFSGLIFSHQVAGTFRYLTGCCLLVDRRIIKDGLFDEDFFMYGEDVELSWRLLRSGWNTTCVNQATVLHEGTGSSHQGGFFYEYHVARGHLLLAGKLIRHLWEIPFCYFGKLLTISIRAITRAIRFRSLVSITAWISALRK